MEAFEQSDLWALSCNLGMLPTQYKSRFPAERKKGATKELTGFSPGPGQVLTIVDGNSAMAERREGAAIMGLEDKVSKFSNVGSWFYLIYIWSIHISPNFKQI